MIRRQNVTSMKRGFTLVELLVVIGIIAVLIGILLPALNRAREAGNTVKCAANLRSIGQGILSYVSENKNTFPPAYQYVNTVITGGIGASASAGGNQTPATGTTGYIHWSSYLYGNKRGQSGANAQGQIPNNDTSFRVSVYASTTGWDMFQCPSAPNGGLPPTNTWKALRDPVMNQAESDSVCDFQAPKVAYTVNEAIMGRNKYILGLSYGDKTAARTYRFVRGGQVQGSAETVLATEYSDDAQVVSGSADGSSQIVKSHRPVSGFWSTEADGDIFAVPTPFGAPRLQPTVYPALPSDVKSWKPGSGSIGTTLNRVGRFHGKGKDAAGRSKVKTNFLYVDGHVETKLLEETLSPKFEWGRQFYSLTPNSDISSDLKWVHP